ncbi:MAG: PAS domain S-box protein [Chloroflexi bacterium]|nr:PAS domain S-box protein [Chloroflexota bacterium]
MPDEKEIEWRLRSALDNMLEGCQIVDREWRYVYVNDAAARQGRRTKQELLGHTVMDMYPGIENTPLFSTLRDCMERRISQQIENEFVFPDGAKAWFEARIEPVPEGLLILSLDITTRKQLEQQMDAYRQRLEEAVAQRTSELAQANTKLAEEMDQHRRAEEGLLLRAAILDNVREPIFLINPAGDFLYINEAACKTYGYNHKEFLSMNIRQLLPSQDIESIESRLKQVLETRELDADAVHRRKDGSLMPVHVRQSLIKSKHGELIVSAICDVGRHSG